MSPKFECILPGEVQQPIQSDEATSRVLDLIISEVGGFDPVYMRRGDSWSIICNGCE